MVTAHLMCTFRAVGWRSLLALCTGESEGFVNALEAVKAAGPNIIYTRPATIAQAGYKRIALNSILLGQVAFPTLQDLRGRFRNAPLSAAVRHWIRDNKPRVSDDQLDRLDEEFLEKTGRLVELIGSVSGLE